MILSIKSRSVTEAGAAPRIVRTAGESAPHVATGATVTIAAAATGNRAETANATWILTRAAHHVIGHPTDSAVRTVRHRTAML